MSKSTTDYKLVSNITQEIVEVLKQKGEHYGDSWKSRGGSGAFMNIARKWDRLENQCSKLDYNIFKAILQDKNGDEGVKDSLLDLIGYGLLILAEIQNNNQSKTPIGIAKPEVNCPQFGHDQYNNDNS